MDIRDDRRSVCSWTVFAEDDLCSRPSVPLRVCNEARFRGHFSRDILQYIFHSVIRYGSSSFVII